MQPMRRKQAAEILQPMRSTQAADECYHQCQLTELKIADSFSILEKKKHAPVV